MTFQEHAVIFQRRYLVCMVELSWRIDNIRSAMCQRFTVVEAAMADMAAAADALVVEVGSVAVVAVARVDAVDAAATGVL
jgi:hypothetical protein